MRWRPKGRGGPEVGGRRSAGPGRPAPDRPGTRLPDNPYRRLYTPTPTFTDLVRRARAAQRPAGPEAPADQPRPPAHRP